MKKKCYILVFRIQKIYDDFFYDSTGKVSFLYDENLDSQGPVSLKLLHRLFLHRLLFSYLLFDKSSGSIIYGCIIMRS